MLWLSRKNRKLSSRHRDRGFTLIEVLAVVAMIGILSAIAAPGWLGFVNNNRLSASQSRVFSALRDAQSKAKRNSTAVTFTITNGATSTFVTVDGQRQNLEEGIQVLSVTGKAGVTNVTLPTTITFDAQGLPTSANGTVFADLIPLRITLNPINALTTSNLKRCTTITTILGSTKSDSGTDCN